MKIIKLEAQNIKRLKAISIEPDGSLVVIGGQNGQGKSSTLDAIEYALGGTSGICDEPVRRGEGKAKIVCDLGDIVVTRMFAKTGQSALAVTNKDGQTFGSPQTMLNELVGRISFDPLEFATMKPADRLETLKAVVGLDFSVADADRELAYDARTQVNRESRALGAQLDSLHFHLDAPAEPVSLEGLMAEFEKREANNRTNTLAADQLATTDSEIEEVECRITEFEDQLAELRKVRNDLQEANLALVDQDTQEIKDQIAGAESANSKFRDNNVHARLTEKIEGLNLQTIRHTKDIEEIDKAKAEELAAVDFPIEGLSFNEDGVSYNDLPFDQASDAEKLRISVAMGLAMNSKLKVLLIRNGSLLDEDNLRMIAEMAAEKDAQVWMERVGKGKECSVIIEDGSIKPTPTLNIFGKTLKPGESISMPVNIKPKQGPPKKEGGGDG